MASVAKYYVVHHPKSNSKRPWKVVIASPHTKAKGNHTLRRFKRKSNAIGYGKRVAMRNGERLAVNRRDGATHKQYDYR